MVFFALRRPFRKFFHNFSGRHFAYELMSQPKHITASPQPSGNGYQVTYEQNGSRKVHRFRKPCLSTEIPPHGAGTFLDPQHHQKLMDRIEDYLKEK